jgi:hypothetical protein
MSHLTVDPAIVRAAVGDEGQRESQIESARIAITSGKVAIAPGSSLSDVAAVLADNVHIDRQNARTALWRLVDEGYLSVELGTIR